MKLRREIRILSLFSLGNNFGNSFPLHIFGGGDRKRMIHQCLLWAGSRPCCNSCWPIFHLKKGTFLIQWPLGYLFSPCLRMCPEGLHYGCLCLNKINNCRFQNPRIENCSGIEIRVYLVGSVMRSSLQADWFHKAKVIIKSKHSSPYRNHSTGFEN